MFAFSPMFASSLFRSRRVDGFSVACGGFFVIGKSAERECTRRTNLRRVGLAITPFQRLLYLALTQRLRHFWRWVFLCLLHHGAFL